jgi:hypothetical protein
MRLAGIPRLHGLNFDVLRHTVTTLRQNRVSPQFRLTATISPLTTRGCSIVPDEDTFETWLLANFY